MSDPHIPDRLAALALPEYAPVLGSSVRDLERLIESSSASNPVLDFTAADTTTFPAPTWAVEAFSRAASGDAPTYTPARGDAGVREALADPVGDLLGVRVDPARELLLTPGTQAALFTAIAALVDHGDAVVVPDPDYLLTERICRFFGAAVERFPVELAADGSALIDLDRLEIMLRRSPRLLILSNPNNPTGAVYTNETVTAIARLAAENGVFVLADELYTRLVYDHRSASHIAAQPDIAGNCLTLLGPSKTESMSGYRVGVAVGPGWLVDRMSDILFVAAIRCPAYAQQILRHWLVDDHEFVRQRIADYQQLRDLAFTVLNSIEGVSVGRPGGTSYIFPSFKEAKIGATTLCRILRERAGIAMSPGFQFGNTSTDNLRICFAQNSLKLRHGLEMIDWTLTNGVEP